MSHANSSERADSAGQESAAGRQRSARPNIVVIMADQWPAAAMGSYGCTVDGLTPALDALAARGMVCDRNYTPIPVCAPARAAMFSGLPPLVNGVTGNDDQPCPARAPLFTQTLREAGYRTGGVGKFHFSSYRQYPPDSLDHLGFDEVVITEDPKHGAWLEWIAAEHPDQLDRALAVSWPMPYLSNYPPDGRNRSAEWERAVARHLRPLQQAPHRRIFHPSPLPAELHQSSWLTDRAIAMIDRSAQRCRSGGDPFLCYVSYVDPHDPYDPPEPYWSRYRWQGVPPPVAQEWADAHSPWQYRRFRQDHFELDGFTAETWARLRAAFFGSCRFVDDQIARLLDHLDRTGLAEDTVVMVTSDHGDLIGDHGLLMKGPWHYDKTVRTPMIMAGPGVAPGTRMSGLSSGVDVCPTVLDLAGVEITASRAARGGAAAGPFAGRVLPYREHDDRSSGHERILIETNASYLGERDAVRTVVTDDGWRLTEFPGQPYGEMFDLGEDPDEQHNRYACAADGGRRSLLFDQLVQASCDQSLIGRR